MFRMPLHRERKWMGRQLQRLYHTIRRAGGDFQTGREVFHRLMMRTVDFDQRPLGDTASEQ